MAVKVLITGFEPFGGEPINPSWEAVKAISDIPEGMELVRRELPVNWNTTVPTLREYVAEVHPEVLLLVGQAGGREGITVERVALNIRAEIADNAGFTPVEAPIVEGGAAAIFSTLPVKAMVKAVNSAGIPARESFHAGTYLCNCALYTGLTLGGIYGFRTGFVHVPYMVGQSETKPVLPLTDMVRALEVMLGTI